MTDPKDPKAPQENGDVIPLLDASEPLDLDRVEAGWSATLEERKTLEARTQRVFRRESGAPTPSAVVQSAEGPMLFPGLHVVNNNGPLSRVARAALLKNFPPGAEAPEESDDDA